MRLVEVAGLGGDGGQVGSHVVRLLRERGIPVRAMTRAAHRVPAGLGVEADFDDPGSLAAAVAGVHAIFLVTAPPVPSADHDLAMVAAARAAGVASIVKLSAIGTGERFGGQVVGAWHVAAEEAVCTSGLAWTILRPSSFASNSLALNLTGDGRQGVIDPRDVAAVAVAALTDPAHHGRVYTLTGPELLSVPEQARILGEVLGRTVTTTDVTELPAGLPPAAAEAIRIGVAWARAGHNAVLTDDVARVLGRPPTGFREWAADHRDHFDQRNPANRSSSRSGAPVVSRTRT
ncbi:NAD(P)H-binding protein [Actinoplanes sp. NBC_00393]|uniref:NAD(P)H-binding protein n=1 Tax=Actinoplanes sp. NBC_00393 TaxID=2975953 RepID=UPI002E1F58F0